MKQSPLKPAAMVMAVAACCAALLVSAAASAQHAGPSGAGAQAPSGALAQVPSRDEPLAARLSLRINQLEAEIRRLTGQNEEMAHQLRQLQARLDKVTSDQELRLRALESRSGTPPPAAEGAGAAPRAAPTPPAAAVPGAERGARVLGSVRQPATSGIAPAQPPVPAPANETPEQLYDRAYGLLEQRDYPGAERVLRRFIEANPKHALTPNAYYWLGRSYFVRNDFENATFAFAEGWQKFPRSDKAPANLLDLGRSQILLGKTREACIIFSRLTQTYTSIDESMKRKVAHARAEAKCRQR